jgi:hypothetical protein
MVGFLSGTVNGKDFQALNMDTIAFSDDGRAYVSVRAFPSSLAHSAKVLTPLTDVVGWMYAKPKPSGFYNGYNVVGARFVRRASVHFDSGQYVYNTDNSTQCPDTSRGRQDRAAGKN